jgi:CubicO group peptidase (beta-lactamase class C family)
LIHGDVHDQGAAMLGGVGGHAGLFSDANDLAVLMQMYLNKGEYGGERYLADSTLAEFTRCQNCVNGNRRGLGFDKPEPDPKKDSPCARCMPLSSFGHSGFTGTFTWVDPETKVVYVFLSNRVHPDADNKKLVTMGVRTKIQDVFYEVLKKNTKITQ